MRSIANTPITERDLRGKVGSEYSSIERDTELIGRARTETSKRHYRRRAKAIR
jgi:hypothetical protein